jgi:hypothetical protein
MATSRKQLVAIIAICGIAIGGFGYLMVATFAHTGQDALTQMSAEERGAVLFLERITGDMTLDDVSALLGGPTAELFIRADWEHFGGSRLSRLQIYFQDSHPYRVTWIKVGSFVYERRIRPASPANEPGPGVPRAP